MIVADLFPRAHGRELYSLQAVMKSIDEQPAQFTQRMVWQAITYPPGIRWPIRFSHIPRVIDALIDLGFVFRVSGPKPRQVVYRKVTAAEIRQRKAEATYVPNLVAATAYALLAA